ncbi:MAG: cation-transporting P-type ATPase, partial [Candidatus Binataceae bacterium]
SAAVGESAPLGKSEATGSFGVTDVAGLAGLSSKEAKARLAELGPNLLVERERSARLAQWLRMLADPMALMLAGASALYMLLGKPHEAAVLAAVIVPVLGVDVLMEARSRSALKKLASDKSHHLPPSTTTRRPLSASFILCIASSALAAGAISRSGPRGNILSRTFV